VVAEQQQSGQGVATFCRERGIGAPQFYAWKKRLHQAEKDQFLAVRLAVGGEPAPAAGRTIEIRLGCGRSIVVEPGFDAAHLRAVLAVLETRS
jgi:hypothetical protein